MSLKHINESFDRLYKPLDEALLTDYISKEYFEPKFLKHLSDNPHRFDYAEGLVVIVDGTDKYKFIKNDNGE